MLYGAAPEAYNVCVPGGDSQFHLGDVIRKARQARRWNQAALGERAALFPISTDDTKIDKSTVSKIENNPYTSEFGTVWRLIAALGLTFADVEHRIGAPFKPVNAPSKQQRRESRAPRAPDGKRSA